MGKFAGVGRAERPDVGRGRVQAGRSGPAQPILRQNLRRAGKERVGEAQARCAGAAGGPWGGAMTWVHATPRATASVCLCFTKRATLASEAKSTGLETPRGPADMPPELELRAVTHRHQMFHSQLPAGRQPRGHSLTS